MKRIIELLLFLFLFLIISQNVIADDELKVRQNLGDGGQILFWYHNSNSKTTEFLFSPGRWTMLGIGPRYSILLGSIKIDTIGYLALIQDITKKHWPVKTIEIESLVFVVPAGGKWIIHIRSLADVAITKSELTFSGRDFLGYQVSPKWQPRLQTEWKYNDENGLNQSLGLGWQRSLTATFNLDGYFGVETKKPYVKVGWFRLNAIFK